LEKDEGGGGEEKNLSLKGFFFFPAFLISLPIP